MEILKTLSLVKIYGEKDNCVKALNEIDLTVLKGEFISIVGSSGSGKTTLLNLLGGLDSPSSGRIWIDGKDISKLANDDLTIFRRKHIGFVFQSYNLIPILNVYDNILLPLELDGQVVDNEYLQEIVNMIGIADKLEFLPHQLSGGQQQRVAIARALITKPAIILADEPTGNLDSKTSIDVMNLLLKSAKTFNQTIVLITHNESLAERADRVIRLEDGKITGEIK